MKRNIYIKNTPYEAAIETFIKKLNEYEYFNVTSEEIDLLNAYGRITSEPVIAKQSVPHYPASAMDGIAVKAESTIGAHENNPVNLDKDVDYILADTGDYIPPEYDSVIMVEDVNFYDDIAQIIKPAVPWQHIRSIGEDLVANELILPSFNILGAYEIASILSASIQAVNVVKKPIVAIIPTGTELIERGYEEIPPGKIVDTNSKMLAYLSQEWGAETIIHPIVPDNKELIEKAVLKSTEKADLVIVCSGSSAGREDYTSVIVEELGELIIHGVAIKPGKPAILGIIDKKPIIGVPGYPVSANLVFNLFAKPLIYKKQGLFTPTPPELESLVSKKIASNMGVDEFINVNIAKVGNSYIAYPLNRGAGITSSLVKSDGLMQIAKESEGVNPSTPMKISINRDKNSIDNTIVSIGSHDICMDILWDLLQKNHNIRLASTNVGSMAGVMALMRKETHMAGIHLLDEETGKYNVKFLDKYLKDTKFLLVNLVKREQGLIVKKNNPLNINSINDLQDKKIRFINRQRGSGTRILLDYLLKQNYIDSANINGYNREEYTHLSVAAAVKNDTCDVGMGIYASAKAFNLDFIPLAEENYDLCILSDLMNKHYLEYLLEAISSNEFKNRVNSFGGYGVDITGNIIYQNNNK
ncbi:Molybdopterin molybdenumtransferase [Candidatus Syntrophocurvum alkaliphilum]|uniref:Molybdopterin molybdenumtransferase n=1 Tax=Candidatus Syntrophocurvum alkaliphilum TaxID=2293317 RepID=A0A6I6D7L6_9FIRM|nr:molybdopterin biosynthesis protein [Candidatus Syntrophocurvum alkaliphilum]QGT99106.1 Molybdopterin molybdenumtransferase [Candidatus Syntrophocurvum alkaliphilum]